MERAANDNTTCMFLNDWEETQLSGLISDFQITADTLDGIDILLASYTYENYSGDAFVLFSKDGGLYEVNGSHCSCYGLEEQWEPSLVTIPELMHRLDKGRMGVGGYWGDPEPTNVYAKELRSVLASLMEPLPKLSIAALSALPSREAA